MHRRLKRQEPRDPRAFRLIPCLGNEINFARFMKHVAKLERRLYWDLALRKLRLQNRRRRAASLVGNPR